MNQKELNEYFKLVGFNPINYKNLKRYKLKNNEQIEDAEFEEVKDDKKISTY